MGGLIAEELTLRGCNAFLVNGAGSYKPPSWVQGQTIKSYEEYKEVVLKLLKERSFSAGVFSSSVADYTPRSAKVGKIKSGQNSLMIDLGPTEKIIEKVRNLHKDLFMVTFKYEEGLSHEELMKRPKSSD